MKMEFTPCESSADMDIRNWSPRPPDVAEVIDAPVMVGGVVCTPGRGVGVGVGVGVGAGVAVGTGVGVGVGVGIAVGVGTGVGVAGGV